jgi:transcription-repair coupling factor (superfamily II helicase)
MEDLELRGAGNLLGQQQHGFIAAVGFDLYCRLLKEAIGNFKQTGVLNA